jgi:signal transduction histidine kinase
MKPRARRTRVRSTAGITIALMGVAILLTGALAFEAWRADRLHRVTVQRVLKDYAQTTAWQILHGIMYDLALVPQSFRPVAGLHMEADGELPPIGTIIPAADSLARCSDPAADQQRYYFRLDLRDGNLTILGPRPAADVRKLLADTVEHRLLTTAEEDWYLAPMFRGGRADPRALVYIAVRDQNETPIAAYGFETCNAAPWEQIFRQVMRDPLLPPVLTGGLPIDSLLSVAVTATGQFTGEYLSPVQYPDTYSAEVNEDAYRKEPRGSVLVRVSLRPDRAGKFVIGGLPRSRLPMLLFLLTLTGGVLAIAVRQLSRERELARLRTDFTSSVSHELRTPLAEILLFAETLAFDRVKDEGERREAVQIIVQEARHLAHVVENVLQFSRAERRMLRLKPERALLADIVREATASFSPLAASYGTHLVLELDDQVVVPVHRGSLHQVLLNLLDNAVKYGPPGQTITIRATRCDGVARLMVEDEGPGIPPEERERIWEPYTRVLTSQNVPGTGIGLAVVRELILAHRGRCWVENRAAGGARFALEVPGATHGGRIAVGVAEA